MPHHLVINILVSGVVSGLVAWIIAKLMPCAASAGTKAGHATGSLVVTEVRTKVPSALRPAVIAELLRIRNSAENNTAATVLDTSATILTRILPRIPEASIVQVATIISEFVRTFEAGFTAELDNVEN